MADRDAATGTKRKQDDLASSPTQLVGFLPIYITQSEKAPKEFLEDVLNSVVLGTTGFSVILANLLECEDAWGPYDPRSNKRIADNVRPQDGRRDEYYVLRRKDSRNVKQVSIFWKGGVNEEGYFKADLMEGSGGQYRVERVSALQGDVADYLGIVTSVVAIPGV